MRAPAFWERDTPEWRAALLRPAAMAYSGVATRRFRRPAGFKASLPVICIGNPTLGGAGKTPTAIAVAERLIAAGHKPVFLSRGYGAPVRAPIAVDPGKHGPEEVGDEALLLARRAATVVCPDRAAGARLAESLGDVIIMDDGFQNRSLAKDLAILVADGRVGFGNGLVFPAGPLRLPLDVQLAEAHAVLLVGSGGRAEGVGKEAERHRLPVLRGSLQPDGKAAAAFAGRQVVGFAGIGRPAKFFDTLEAIGAELVENRGFPDHHRFTEGDARELLVLADRAGAVLVTTEKDAARLSCVGGEALRRLARLARPLPVRLELDEDSEGRLDGLLARALPQ